MGRPGKTDCRSANRVDRRRSPPSEAPHRTREIWVTGRASVTRSADGRLSRSGPSPPKPPESLAPSTSRGNRHRSSTEPLPDDASADARPADVGRGCTPGRGDWPMRLMRHRLACRCYSTSRLPCGRMHNRPCFSNINCGSGPTISRPRHRMSMSRVFGSGTSIVMAVQPSQRRAQTWHNSTMPLPVGDRLVRFSHTRSAAMARAGRDSSVQHRWSRTRPRNPARWGTVENTAELVWRGRRGKKVRIN